MTQESVTLPREVVEQVLHALWNTAHGEPCFSKHVRDSMASLRAALERPQDHVPDAVSMVPDGWKLVPVEPTQEMLDAYIHMQGRFSSARSDFAAMLAAAPQPPTTEDCSAVEQPQGEQEPVAVVDFTTEGWRKIVDALRTLPDGAQLYTRPQNLQCKSTQARLATLWGYVKEQPKLEPLTESAIVDIVIDMNGNEPTALFWRDLARAIEAAHDIK